MAHSRLAASAAPRWIRCPGSIAYIEWLKAENKIPLGTTNQAAERGTAVHTIIEYAILKGVHPQTLALRTASKIAGFALTSHDLGGAQICYDFVQRIWDEYDEVLPEKKYSLDFVYDEDVGGTADIVALAPKKLHIGDYKNGRTPVEVEDNYQLMIYSLGSYTHEREFYPKIKTIANTIIQPNAPHPDGVIHTIEYPIKELLKFEEQKLVPAIEAIRNKTASLIPGTVQCTWCDARHLCEANAKQTMHLAQLDFANVADPRPELPAPKMLTPEQLVFILDNKARLLAFLNACEKHVEEQIIATDKTFGHYNLTPTLGNRRYIDEKKRNKILRKHGVAVKEVTVQHEPTFMTVTQLEGYLRSCKKFNKDKISKIMDEITDRPVTGKKLERVITAEKDFRKLTARTSRKLKTSAKSKSKKR